MGSHARRTLNIIGQALIGLAAIVIILSIRSGFASASTGAITDYANFPADLPEDCSATDALVDLTFTSPQGEASDLRRLAVNPGDTITMTWTGFAPNCAGVDVALALNQSDTDRFDIDANQTLLPGYATCGAACVPSDGVYTLSVTAPDNSSVCYFQIDAVLGAPLAVVGPDGSYYSSVLRRDGGPDLLVSAKNAGSGCTSPEVPAQPEPPAQPEAPVEVLTSTLTKPLPEAQPVPASEIIAVPEVGETLPFTGASSVPLAGLAITLLGAGVGLVFTSRRIQAI